MHHASLTNKFIANQNCLLGQIFVATIRNKLGLVSRGVIEELYLGLNNLEHGRTRNVAKRHITDVQNTTQGKKTRIQDCKWQMSEEEWLNDSDGPSVEI